MYRLINIQLKPEQEKFIQDKIASGAYSNVEDTITEAFKLSEIRETKLKELQDKIAVGTAEAAKGQLTDGEEVFNRLKDKINRIADKTN